MRVFVEHFTNYRYSREVLLDPHTFRLRPRTTTTQRLLDFEIQIFPEPAGMTECLDQDGTLALRAWFTVLTRRLSVRTRFAADLVRNNPFDFLIRDERMKLSLWYPPLLDVALLPYRDSQRIGDDVKTYATAVADGAQWSTLPFLSSLCGQIFQSYRPMTRSEGHPWPSTETLRRKEGSCRDVAVLFCDCCRAMGIAARFVSGYECASTGQRDAYMHAWAEVYLPGAGWRGYDPSRGVVVADKHVAVAAAFHPELAAPVSGSYGGEGESHMDASVELRVEPEPKG